MQQARLDSSNEPDQHGITSVLRTPLRRPACVLSCLWTGLFAPISWAQTLTDGNATFERTASSWDNSPAGNFRGVSATLTTDHLFETGWAFRAGNDTREFFFTLPDTQNFNGNTSTMTWANVNGRGLFSARETVRVFDVDGLNGASPSGRVEMTLEVTNFTGAPLDIGLFHLADLDVGGGAAGDSTVLLRAGPHPTIGISDTGVTAQYRGINATRWQVRDFNSGNGIGGLLNDAARTEFNNTGAPGGPFDFTGGMQWADRTLQAGASFTVSVLFTINANVIKPELVVQKTNNVGGVVVVDGMFDWTLLMINASNSPTVTFQPGQLLLRDQLPNAGLVYDATIVTMNGGATGTVDCAVGSADLICTAATAVSIPGAGSVRVVLPVGPIAEGSFTNPRVGGTCSIDPNGLIEEDTETNNGCANMVQVTSETMFRDGFETQ